MRFLSASLKDLAQERAKRGDFHARNADKFKNEA